MNLLPRSKLRGIKSEILRLVLLAQDQFAYIFFFEKSMSPWLNTINPNMPYLQSLIFINSSSFSINSLSKFKNLSLVLLKRLPFPKGTDSNTSPFTSIL